MPIILKIRDSNRLLPESDCLRVLKKGTLTIGRETFNDLVLPDPDQRISRQHCLIKEVDGLFYLTDTSTNGVFLNQEESPIGRGNTVSLETGDIIKIFQYEIEVLVESPTAVISKEPEPEKIPAGDIQNSGSPEKQYRWEWDSPISTLDEILRQPENQGFGEEESEEFSKKEGIDLSLEEVFDIPQPVPEIAPDLDQEREKEKTTTEKAVRSEIRKKSVSQAGSRNLALEQFLKGAGLEGLRIPEEKLPQIMEIVGAIFREVVRGLMELLGARSNIKTELRLKQTMIGQTENNPLQFAPNVEEAMTMLLTKEDKGYLPPLQAFQKSFDNLKAHELAILAGLQAALLRSLDRFDPKKIEEQINKEKGLSKKLTPKKFLYWEEYIRLYRIIVDEVEDDFYKMFGLEFTRAYEEQVRKLNPPNR